MTVQAMLCAAGSGDDNWGIRGGSMLRADLRSPFAADGSELELQPLRLRTDAGGRAESQGALPAPLVSNHGAADRKTTPAVCPWSYTGVGSACVA